MDRARSRRVLTEGLVFLGFLFAAEAGAANISVSPGNFAFSPIEVGQSASLFGTTTFSNYGADSYLDTVFQLTTGTNFAVLNPSCDLLGCSFEVQFNPASIGAKTDTLTIRLQLASGAQASATASLSGTATAPVPAPAALPLFLTAFGILGSRAWRRRVGPS